MIEKLNVRLNVHCSDFRFSWNEITASTISDVCIKSCHLHISLSKRISGSSARNSNILELNYTSCNKGVKDSVWMDISIGLLSRRKSPSLRYYLGVTRVRAIILTRLWQELQRDRLIRIERMDIFCNYSLNIIC